jgi:hypothetical protein
MSCTARPKDMAKSMASKYPAQDAECVKFECVSYSRASSSPHQVGVENQLVAIPTESLTHINEPKNNIKL